MIETQKQLAVIISQLARVNEDVKEIKHKLDTHYISKVEHEGAMKRIAELEANMRWIVRTLFGAAVTGIIAFFFTVTK